MKLLIVTQMADRSDPVMGFFHHWIEQLSKHCESVRVICLQEGEHVFPQNVDVYSLGKECGRSRVKYIWRFYTYIWKFRNDYDAVFVHMNQEYVLLGGFFWRLLRKRVILWRNHKKGSMLTRISGLLSHTVCYTSPSAYVASFKNSVKMPIGIDTDMFKPRGNADPRSILFLGRLDAVKRPEMLLQALDLLAKKGVAFNADVIGDPTPGRESFAHELRKRFSSVPNVTFKPAVRNDETVSAYTSHRIYINLTPSGSFDKTIGEAAASGCIIVVGNDALRGVIPDELLVDVNSVDSVLRGIEFALDMNTQSQEMLSRRLRGYVLEKHSLTLLSSRLMELYGNRV